MGTKSAFRKFAPTILKVYQRDKEGFWSAVMAPFLANEFSLEDSMKHLKVDVQLLSAFRGLHGESTRILSVYSKPFEFDVSKWKSNRSQYFKDAYPVFAFLAVWMSEEKLNDLIEKFDQILKAGVFAVSGYGILDENVDSVSPNPVEVLTAFSLIAEYETLALNLFGVSDVNLSILHKMRKLFLDAEIREKYCRNEKSPYLLDQPENLGAKGANAVGPFMLCLEKLGRADQIDLYWKVFLLFGAAIQMIDDWQDLEKDLAAGHYSYLTINKEKLLTSDSPAKVASQLRKDKELVKFTYETSKEMVLKSKEILVSLQDKHLHRLVDVTELRLDHYFQKELKIHF